MRYKIIRWSRAIRIFFGGCKEREKKHYLFTLDKALTPKEIWGRLWPDGWGYNAISTTYRGQIFTVKKLVPPRHQYHLRFYKNGDVSGHHEVEPIQFPLEHLDGVELRALTPRERNAIGRLLTGKVEANG